MNLKNKKILITGATGGIGNSLVKKFYDHGSLIMATGTREEKLENLKKNFSNIEVVKFLLDNNANINLYETDMNITPVMEAVVKNNFEITKLLLEQNNYDIYHINKCFLITSSISNLDTAKFLPAFPISSHNLGESKSVLIALVKASLFFIGMSNPVLSGIIASLQPWWSVVITGLPQAAASISIFGNPSP